MQDNKIFNLFIVVWLFGVALAIAVPVTLIYFLYKTLVHFGIM